MLYFELLPLDLRRLLTRKYYQPVLHVLIQPLLAFNFLLPNCHYQDTFWYLIEHGQVELVKWFCRNYCPQNDLLIQACRHAAERQQYSVVLCLLSWMIAKGYDLNDIHWPKKAILRPEAKVIFDLLERNGYDLCPFLPLLISIGAMEQVQILFQRMRITPMLPIKQYIMAACRSGDKAILQLKVNFLQSHNFLFSITILAAVVKHGTIAMLQLMLEHGTKIGD